MANYFFDTSGLVKYYHDEAGSPSVRQAVNRSENRVFISDLSIVELISSLAKKVRIGELRAVSFHNTRRRFFADIAGGKFQVVTVMQRHGRDAVKLLVKHATQRGLRTLDALQLAMALDLKAQDTLDHFVCADIKLQGIAKLEKISFVNPEKV